MTICNDCGEEKVADTVWLCGCSVAKIDCKWWKGGHTWYQWNSSKEVCRKCGKTR